jgi:hypothetical protein
MLRVAKAVNKAEEGKQKMAYYGETRLCRWQYGSTIGDDAISSSTTTNAETVCVILVASQGGEQASGIKKIHAGLQAP